jgi:hypothetical protein
VDGTIDFMAYTKEALSEQTPSKEALPNQGTPSGEMGIGHFGSSVFGGTSGFKWDKEVQQSQSFTKEALPST